MWNKDIPKNAYFTNLPLPYIYEDLYWLVPLPWESLKEIMASPVGVFLTRYHVHHKFLLTVSMLAFIKT
jgi:hypothetical protein